MVSAYMGRAKIAGLVVDRSETGKPGDFSDMTNQELYRYVLVQAFETLKRAATEEGLSFVDLAR
jgi:hypothetical protein